MPLGCLLDRTGAFTAHCCAVLQYVVWTKPLLVIITVVALLLITKDELLI